ncbi:MAG TPA: hypothetical protein VKB88_27580 [Bryobacteraceae bacterium]|nr:hypothetical protein [Bryobacteraceae bacterium]
MRWPENALRLSGVLLIILGVLHLAATSHIAPLLSPMRASEGYPLARGATLLNHVMTGILLLPLGVSTWAAASTTYWAPSWARTVLMFNSLAMLCAPISVMVFMGDPAYLRAPLFLAGVCLATAVPILMLVALWRLRRTVAPTRYQPPGAPRPDHV